ncbi:hypothetical protein FSST1_006400 [Fusarium sambucinum]
MADPNQPLEVEPTTVGGPLTFLHLPGEIRNAIYDIILLQPEPILPWFPGPVSGLASFNLQSDPTGLFRVNKTVHREATLVFYGQNRFHSEFYEDELASFFQLIGTRNASSIRHIIIHFPDFSPLPPSLRPGIVTIGVESARILGHILSSCASLSTLETNLESTKTVLHDLENLDNQDVAVEALNLVDNHFRALPSLPEIVLQVHEDEPSDFLRRTIESYGWTLSKQPNPEKKCGCGCET